MCIKDCQTKEKHFHHSMLTLFEQSEKDFVAIIFNLYIYIAYFPYISLGKSFCASSTLFSPPFYFKVSTFAADYCQTRQRSRLVDTLFYVYKRNGQEKRVFSSSKSTLRRPTGSVANTWGGGGEGGGGPLIFWKTIVFCSKTMEMCGGILSKQ